MERITSRKNPLLEHIRRLDSGPYRRQSGAFLCDSPKLVDEALCHGVTVTCVVVSDGVALPEHLPEGVRCVSVPADVGLPLAPAHAPGDAGGCAPCRTPRRLAPSRRTLHRPDGVQDPGNVGTVLRTADAFGCTAALLLPGCADLYSLKTLRASMGAVFRLRAYTVDADALRALLTAANLPLYGAALRHDTVDVRCRDLRRCAIAVGSEGRGLSDTVLALCDETLRIPMADHCESLNAAAAAAVLLWEAYRAEEGM